MKLSIYTTVWNLSGGGFDLEDACRNWSLFADQISIAVNTSDDDTLKRVLALEESKRFPLSVVETGFDLKDDPFAYGKIENAALQNCSGELLIQQNLDERLGADPVALRRLGGALLRAPFLQAYMLPVINLYGSKERYTDIARKWYLHKPGLRRGAAKIGIKADGRPDYNKTSTDELLDENGDLVLCQIALQDLSLEGLRAYVEKGMPFIYHLGYTDLHSRAKRAAWWKEYWIRATNGDPNSHITDVDELEKRLTQEHGLPLWRTS